MLRKLENQNVANCWQGRKICLKMHLIEQKHWSILPQLRKISTLLLKEKSKVFEKIEKNFPEKLKVAEID